MNTNLREKQALLLDMNGTFMFGEDRFGDDQNYHEYYQKIGGGLSAATVNGIVKRAYNYLLVRYPDDNYRNSFPSLFSVITQVTKQEISHCEIEKIIKTFSFHEHGHIPTEYVSVLARLRKKYVLATVIDIWSPKKLWLESFEQLKFKELFSALSFSSDHGAVKPWPMDFFWSWRN